MIAPLDDAASDRPPRHLRGEPNSVERPVPSGNRERASRGIASGVIWFVTIMHVDHAVENAADGRHHVELASVTKSSQNRRGILETDDVARNASPRVLFASPSPDELIEDAQNEGCNI